MKATRPGPDQQLCQTDLSVLYGLFRATVQHNRILVSSKEIYPFCKQDPRNVRWAIARLKNNLSLISTQRVPGVGIMWLWCGKKKLRQFLLENLKELDSVKSAYDKPKRMNTVKEMYATVKKIDKEPKARTVHAPEEA